MSFLMRTVAEEYHVSSKLDEHMEEYPHVGQVWEGVKWMLSRKPEEGMSLRELSRPDLYLFNSSNPPAPTNSKLPIITVLYKFDDKKVTIIDIKITSHQ